MSTGSAIGLAAVALSLPLLTRLFDTRDFGTYAVYTSVLSILLVLSAMKYELAIPLPEADSDAEHLVSLSLILVVCWTVIVGVACILAASSIASWSGASRLVAATVLPVALFSAGSFTVLSHRAIRTGAFSTVGRSVVTQRVGQVLAQAASGGLGRTAAGLCTGDAFGRAAAVTYLAARSRKTAGGWGISFSRSGIQAVAHRYRRFPQYTVWGSLANVAANQLPFILLALFYGQEVTGTFAVAAAITSIPSVVIAAPMGHAYLREGALAWRESPRRLRSLYLTTLRRVMILGIVPAAILVISAPAILPVVLGDQWHETAQYVQVLAVGFYGAFVTQPLLQTLAIVGQQPVQLVLDLITLLGVVGAFGVSAALGVTGYGAVVVYSCALLGASAIAVIVPLMTIRRLAVNEPAAGLREADSS